MNENMFARKKFLREYNDHNVHLIAMQYYRNKIICSL